MDFGIVCSKYLFGSKPIKNINMKWIFNDIDHDLTCAGVLLRDHGSDAVKELVVEVGEALEADPDVAGDNVYTELTFCNIKEMVEKLELDEDLIDVVTDKVFVN